MAQRRIRWLILLGAAACAHGSGEQDLLSALGEMRAAQVDHDHKNDAGFLAHAAAAVRKSPGHPFARYTLACAYGRAGRAAEAVAELDRLAARDIVFDVDHDTDFDPIRHAAAFAALRGRLAAIRARRIERSRLAFGLAARDLLTEGIAYDQDSGDFFLSSVHHRKIVRVARDGRASDFVTDPALYGVLALAVDRPRRLLWACSSTMPEMDRFAMAESGRGALFAFDLVSGAQKLRFALSGPGRHNCNDLAVAADGSVFVADPLAHTIYRLAPAAGALTPLVPAGRLQSPQGIVPEPGARSLLVADYVLGLVRVSIEDGGVTPVGGPDDAVLVGADGLCAVPGGDLVAIQNGIEPHRALRLRLSPDRRRVAAVEVVDFNHSAYREPTLCTMVGRDLYYVAASQWSRFSGGSTEPLDPPVVLTTRLE